MKSKLMQFSIVLLVWINLAIFTNADGKEIRQTFLYELINVPIKHFSIFSYSENPIDGYRLSTAFIQDLKYHFIYNFHHEFADDRLMLQKTEKYFHCLS